MKTFFWFYGLVWAITYILVPSIVTIGFGMLLAFGLGVLYKLWTMIPTEEGAHRAC